MRAERAFVEALVVYFTFKVEHLGEEVLKATRDQPRAIMQDRHGLKPDNRQFEVLKKSTSAATGSLPAGSNCSSRRVQADRESPRNMS